MADLKTLPSFLDFKRYESYIPQQRELYTHNRFLFNEGHLPDWTYEDIEIANLQGIRIARPPPVLAIYVPPPPLLPQIQQLQPVPQPQQQLQLVQQIQAQQQVLKQQQAVQQQQALQQQQAQQNLAAIAQQQQLALNLALQQPLPLPVVQPLPIIPQVQAQAQPAPVLNVTQQQQLLKKTQITPPVSPRPKRFGVSPLLTSPPNPGPVFSLLTLPNPPSPELSPSPTPASPSVQADTSNEVSESTVDSSVDNSSGTDLLLEDEEEPELTIDDLHVILSQSYANDEDALTSRIALIHAWRHQTDAITLPMLDARIDAIFNQTEEQSSAIWDEQTTVGPVVKEVVETNIQLKFLRNRLKALKQLQRQETDVGKLMPEVLDAWLVVHNQSLTQEEDDSDPDIEFSELPDMVAMEAKAINYDILINQLVVQPQYASFQAQVLNLPPIDMDIAQNTNTDIWNKVLRQSERETKKLEKQIQSLVTRRNRLSQQTLDAANSLKKEASPEILRVLDLWSIGNSSQNDALLQPDDTKMKMNAY